MASERYDVVVVGAGPAGSMAAKRAAEKGAKVMLLERDPVIGSPVRCGEGVSGVNLAKLIPLQERWIAAKVKGVVIYAPDGTGVTIHSEKEIGLILERNLFDRYLAELAAEAGACVLTRADVDGIVIENGAVKGVYYTRLGRRHRVEAAVTVGADGVESRVGRWAGLKTQITPADLESAYQFYLAGVRYDHRYCHFYVGHEVAPGGYIWVFPKSETVASVGIGVAVNLADAGTAYQKLTHFISTHFPDASVVGEMAGGVPVARPMKVPLTDGLLLAGDAARHCNPLTGGGIFTAMLAGSYAGEVAADAVAKGDVSRKGLSAYLRMLEEDIVKVHLRAYRIKEGVLRLTDEMMNATAREVLSRPSSELTIRNVFLTALKHQPRLALDIIRAFI